MSHPFDHRRPTELEDRAYAEAVQHFAEPLKQFPASRDAIDRLERDVAKIALAANMAAARPISRENAIQADDGAQWHKAVDLIDNICLCHRPIIGGAEFAVLEHFPKRGTNEIWNQGGNAGELLKTFTQEQRQALQVWTEDMTAQVKEFLAEKFSGHDMTRVADCFMLHFNRPVSHSQRQTQTHEQNQSRGVKI
jgi:hypothetical protein